MKFSTRAVEARQVALRETGFLEPIRQASARETASNEHGLEQIGRVQVDPGGALGTQALGGEEVEHQKRPWPRMDTMVGASADKTKFSYGVLRVLHETGYDMIPVNPNPALTEIRGIKVYPNLASIDRPVDMVQVFRRREELYGITEEAIEIGAKVLWGQIGVYDDAAAQLAEDAGMRVVMNRCPKIELFRPFWKPRLDLAI